MVKRFSNLKTWWHTPGPAIFVVGTSYALITKALIACFIVTVMSVWVSAIRIPVTVHRTVLTKVDIATFVVRRCLGAGDSSGKAAVVLIGAIREATQANWIRGIGCARCVAGIVAPVIAVVAIHGAKGRGRGVCYGIRAAENEQAHQKYSENQPSIVNLPHSTREHLFPHTGRTV